LDWCCTNNTQPRSRFRHKRLFYNAVFDWFHLLRQKPRRRRSRLPTAFRTRIPSNRALRNANSLPTMSVVACHYRVSIERERRLAAGIAAKKHRARTNRRMTEPPRRPRLACERALTIRSALREIAEALIFRAQTACPGVRLRHACRDFRADRTVESSRQFSGCARHRSRTGGSGRATRHHAARMALHSSLRATRRAGSLRVPIPASNRRHRASMKAASARETGRKPAARNWSLAARPGVGHIRLNGAVAEWLKAAVC
jgi:hypothetical protein